MAHNERESSGSDDFTIDFSVDTNDSSSVNTAGLAFGRVFVPATFDGTEFDVQVSDDNVTFVDAYDAAGTKLTITPTATTSMRIPDGAFPAKFMRLQATTNQAQDVVFIVQMSS